MTTSGSVPSAQSTSSNATGSAWTTDRRTPPVEDDQLRYRTFRSNSERMSRYAVAPAPRGEGGLR
jgi:hypothetical protein